MDTLYYVYIIYSIKYNKYYKGFSTHPNKRLDEHNDGTSRYTSNFIPWKMVYLEIFDSKREALIREKKLKKYSKNQVKNLINSPLNKLNTLR